MAAWSPGEAAATLARPPEATAADTLAGAGSANASIPTTTQRLGRTKLRALARTSAISRPNPGEP